MINFQARVLAPTGTLRAGINLSNGLFTSKDPDNGELRGVSIDLMHELAARMGVPLELVVHATPGDVTDAVEADTWDVAVLAIEPARAEKIAFSPPMTEIEATFLVHKNSALQTPAQVDSPNIRIATTDKAGYELYLTRTLRSATLVRTKTFAESVKRFLNEDAQALAGLRPALIGEIEKMPNAKFVEGNFMTVNHGIGTPRVRGETASAYLDAFVQQMLASGFVAASIQRHGVRGLAAIAQ